MKVITVTSHVLSSKALPKQIKRWSKRRHSLGMFVPCLLRFQMESQSRKKSETYLRTKFSRKIMLSSIDSLHHRISRRLSRVSFRNQALARILALKRCHCRSNVTRTHKAKAKTGKPKIMDSRKFSGLETNSSGSNLTLISSKYEHPSPQMSVEWRIMETSMEDGLMGRAAVIADEQIYRSKMPAEGVEQDSCGETSALSSSQVLGKMQNEDSCHQVCNGLAGQFLSSQSGNSCFVDEMKVDSTVDDHLGPREFVCSNQRISEPKSLESSGGIEKPLDSASDDIKTLIRNRRRSESFPPPLASLARKNYAHFPSQLASLQLHPIRSNGRILLHEVRTLPQPLFKPIRKNGRLVLQLIRCDSENLPAIEPEVRVPVEVVTAVEHKRLCEPDAAPIHLTEETSHDFDDRRELLLSALTPSTRLDASVPTSDDRGTIQETSDKNCEEVTGKMWRFY